MKRDLHNLNSGFIQLKRNVHYNSTDHNCPKKTPQSEWAPIAQDSSKANQCTRKIKRMRLAAHHKEIIAQQFYLTP